MDYSKTVNLLQTDFPMKGDLPVREPKMLERWEKSGLYGKIQKKSSGKPTFLLHDGPPYANGAIHMGHALNKILKDFVVKFNSLFGFRSPFKPGWDCHGLPIEHALFKELGMNKHQISRQDFRKKATSYAMKFVDIQREEFKRLGVLGDWENPYLTLSNSYEADILEVFYELRDKGVIFRTKKPGYWCAYDETALAEAEVEYADKKSDSVFVRFKVQLESLPGKFKAFQAPPPALYVLIWTTTPWTLPANVGLAFHPREKYVVVETDSVTPAPSVTPAKAGVQKLDSRPPKDGSAGEDFRGNDGVKYYIVADKLMNSVAAKIKTTFKQVGEPFLGKEFLGLLATNPIHGRATRAINAEFVTMEDGTGIVHIAPGHGLEDFAAGVEYKLEVVSPVNERGLFDDTVGHKDLIGKHVLKDANKAVMEVLGEDLLYHGTIQHSYPHCWRCKNPIIFRATEQWFLRVDEDLRKKLLREIDAVRWEPEYGIHRIKGMVETRPDWCLSRQRHWGVPIAVFFCGKCREPLHSKEVDKKIVELVGKSGSGVWYEKSTAELLGKTSIRCGKCGSAEFTKEEDILDVWFDSGVSWHAVLEREFAKPKPGAVMYLEGSDQHRGWFQTSLIPAVTLRDKAPFDVVLTHGFVVDGKGYKMSKSQGNVIAPQEIIKQYGADILRLWVAMSDYREDVRLSPDILKQVIDVYRRFRNTFRFLLQNTVDFKWSGQRVPFSKLEEIDRWILVNFEEVKGKVLKAYEAYEFHVVLSELNRFAAVTLSGFYLDALKDRLYCEALDSPRRRSTQTALYQLTHGLAVLLSPLLSFTAEEAFLELRKNSNPTLAESVFLEELSGLEKVAFDQGLSGRWEKILQIRGIINDVLDQKRKADVLKSSQEAAVKINLEKLDAVHKDLVTSGDVDWPFVLQMAEVAVTSADDSVTITKTALAKCERCWRHRAEVGSNAKHPTLCTRCAAVVG